MEHEQLVSYETARLAAEKGFNWKCYDVYIGEKLADRYNIAFDDVESSDDQIETLRKEFEVSNDMFDNTKSNLLDHRITVPTQSLLQKWLRDEHNNIVIALPFKDHQSDVNDEYIFKPLNNINTIQLEFKTYEEALEIGLLETLKLIK